MIGISDVMDSFFISRDRRVPTQLWWSREAQLAVTWEKMRSSSEYFVSKSQELDHEAILSRAPKYFSTVLE